MARPSLPPGPRLPAYLQTALLVLAPERTLTRWRRRYGEVFAVHTLTNGRLVILADPAAIKQVFTGPHDVLRAGEANAVLAPVLGDRSVLLLDGPEHLRQRRLLLPPFHGERMRAYEAIMEQVANRDINTWPVGRPFALRPHMQAITLDVIVRAVFGLAEGEEADELKRRLRHLLEPMSDQLRLIIVALTAGLLGLQGANRRFLARVTAVDELLYAMIARRRAAVDLADRDDICSMLLEDELERGDESYLDAVVKETLRSRPVLPSVARVLHEPYEIAGFELPAGMTVVPSINLTHGRAELYPHPREFRPERFLGGRADAYSWLPFGGGPRRCVGAAFAEFEMRTVIRIVLGRTALEPTSRRAESVKRNGLTLVPSRGTRVIQRTPPRDSVRLSHAERAVTL